MASGVCKEGGRKSLTYAHIPSWEEAAAAAVAAAAAAAEATCISHIQTFSSLGRLLICKL